MQLLAPSLESVPSTAPTTTGTPSHQIDRAWLTYGLARVVVELRKLFLQVFLDTRRDSVDQSPAALREAVIQAIIGTAIFPSEDRFEAAWRFAFQQSPYSHIWQLIDMTVEEVTAMLVALESQ